MVCVYIVYSEYISETFIFYAIILGSMRRKLIQHGLSSLTVSLPRKWVQSNNLRKGNEIELEEHHGRLIISTQKHREHKKIDIDITGAHPMIRKIIGATFKAGYDEVAITFGSYDELKAVQELMREQFTGFGITHQGKKSIVILNLSQMNFEEFDSALKRFFFVLNHMASEVYSALEKNDFNWLKNTTLMKIESDKLADYCRRAINMGYSVTKPAPLYTIVEQLEKTVDRYRDLCEYVAGNKTIVRNDIKSFLKELVEFQHQFYQLFYKFELKEIVRFGKKKEELQKKLDRMATGGQKKEMKIITLLDRILNLVFDLNGPLMTTRI